jgi:hypothetical protein
MRRLCTSGVTAMSAVAIGSRAVVPAVVHAKTTTRGSVEQHLRPERIEIRFTGEPAAVHRRRSVVHENGSSPGRGAERLGKVRPHCVPCRGSRDVAVQVERALYRTVGDVAYPAVVERRGLNQGGTGAVQSFGHPKIPSVTQTTVSAAKTSPLPRRRRDVWCGNETSADDNTGVASPGAVNGRVTVQGALHLSVRSTPVCGGDVVRASR